METTTRAVPDGVDHVTGRDTREARSILPQTRTKRTSFDDPIISIARPHVMGEKPFEGYTPHPSDAGNIDSAQELRIEDYNIITTGQEN